MKESQLGTLRAYWLGIVCCIGGLGFGYDSGVGGGVLTFKSFMDSFRYGPDYGTHNEALVQSLVIATQQAGAFAGCFIIWPLAALLGRKWTLVASSIIFCIGCAIETIDSHSLPVFYVGRVIAGLGLGGSSVIVPMFISEMAPESIRGRLGSMFQLNFTIGIFIAYWVDYAVERRVSDEIAMQWQIPVALQILVGGLLGLGALTLKESARWLTQKQRYDKALQSLQWIRGTNNVDAEFEEIKQSIDNDREERKKFTIYDIILRRPADRNRLFLAAFVFTAQQCTGSTALAYYGPFFFGLIAGGDASRQLLLSAIFGAVKVVACGIYVWFLAEQFGRKAAMVYGGISMGACMLSSSIVLKFKPPPESGGVPPASIAMVALIFINIAIYSWGPVPWPFVGELFPPYLREFGVAVSVAHQWLFNFVFSLATPYMIDDIGWGSLLFFAMCDFGMALICYVCVKETSGKTLEEIQRMYGADAYGDDVPHKKQSGSTISSDYS